MLEDRKEYVVEFGGGSKTVAIYIFELNCFKPVNGDYRIDMEDVIAVHEISSENLLKSNYSICPECHRKMQVDEEYYATNQAYWDKELVYWCEYCEDAYAGGKKS